MTGKIFRAIMLAAGGVLLASLLIILGCLYDYFDGVQKHQLWAELDMAVAGVETSGMAYFDALYTDSNRLTWIAADGSVLYDAEADQDNMENHASRAEVQEALTNGKGSSERYSDTLLEKTLYCAKRLSDGSVLRISIRHATMAVLIISMLQPICVVLLVALFLAFGLASRLSRRIVEPLNTLDLDHPLDNQTYDEITPLLRRISQQSRQIYTQLCELRQKQDEFTQVITSMNEGLVLLDNKGRILSINPAAQKLFSIETATPGQDFLTIERSRDIGEAITKATQTGHGEVSRERNGRVFQMDVSRIESEGRHIGVVLLIFDVTEKVEAERTRREFTANVSHELKTPLTAILGSSELLQSGMVKPEDMPRFVGHIHKEAARLLTLIEDILRLSQLDEGVDLPRENVDLAVVVAETAHQLQQKAEQCQVQLQVQTESCTLSSVTRLVSEIVYNLMENAIKYNVPGGLVTVTTSKEGTLTVTDTGIGIPPEQQSRVFERFYRVDKSHSKAIGGTGLGLSIVKHAAAYLGATIDLQSEVGKGTTVRVSF